MSKSRTPATEARYGGRYLGRGGATEVLEGDWEPHRLVVLEFVPALVLSIAGVSAPEGDPRALRPDRDHSPGRHRHLRQRAGPAESAPAHEPNG
ncbi:DUF1330 domain-containing protein [Ensifer adhaerens]|uniref:DUF1330 domain-containing protein n=1 Tax=Ensifer adhaerens TaxID=106592 RepID=UPI003D03A0EA